MKPRNLLLALAVAAASIASALTLAPAARADCVSDAAVTYVGSDWGPVPMWRVSVPTLNASWDVQAADADAARAAVAPLIHCPVASPDPVPTDTTPTATTPTDTTPTSTSTGPSGAAVSAATTLLADAEITYVGNSWGPLPIWRVHVPSRNATYDVAAATAEDARAAVLSTLAASIDASPTVPSSPTVSASDGATTAAQVPGQAVAVDASPVAPAPAVVKVTPAKAKTAKQGVHHAPATAKRNPS